MRNSGARLAFLLLGSLGVAQTVLPGLGTTTHLVNEDMAILESQIARKDLPCEVKPTDPSLGFDLRFHAGYDFKIPLKELAGDENLLKIIFKVTPASSEVSVYFQDSIRVPSIVENAVGEATLNGKFELGEGKYHVDWLVRDREDRICSYYWDTTAELPSRDKDIVLSIAANTIEASRTDQFTEDPPVQRGAGSLLNVKILVNFAPQNQNSAALLQPTDTQALVTMMRRIARSPKVGRFSVVAFNIQEQRVLYRQSSSDRIDFPALGKAIKDVAPGLVDARLLVNKRGETEFLADFVRKEMEGPDAPDALIFAGPKYMVNGGSPEAEVKSSEVVSYPVFYLNYNLYPQLTPWRDSIGRVVRVLGGKEYSINRPRDMFFAVTEMVDRIVESKQGRVTPPSR